MKKTTNVWTDKMNGLDAYLFCLKPGSFWHEATATLSNYLKWVAFLCSFSEGNEDNGTHTSGGLANLYLSDC